MAISIIKQPNAVSLSRHQVEYQLETDNWITVAGSKTLFVIKITASPAVDDSFQIDWGVDPITDPDESVVMTCKAAPDDTGNQFIDNAGAIPLDDWADLFFADISKNFLLTRDFVVTRTTADALPAIQFQAREKGAKFKIEFTEALAWMVEFLNIDGTDQVFQTNMKQVLQVHVEDVYKSGIFELKHEEQRVPDLSKRSLFDIHTVLDAFVENNLPTYNDTVIRRADKLSKQYFVRYYERYGDTVTEQEVITGAVKTVMDGVTTFKFFNQNKDIFADHLTPSKSFLTWQPNDKDIAEKQQEFLYFPITGAGTSEIKSKVDIFYTDGSSDLDVEIEVVSVPATEQYEFYVIPVGFDQLVKSKADAGKITTHYSIKITDQADIVISELRTYYLDRKVHVTTSYLLYKNSLGGYDTLRITGEVSQGLDVTKEVFETVLPSTYALIDAQYTEFNVSGREMIELSTGHMTMDELVHLQEFMLSDSRYRITDVFTPFIVDTKTFTFRETSADLYVLSFKALRAFDTNSVSDD